MRVTPRAELKLWGLHPVEGRLLEAVRDGHSDYGWEGDPFLFPVYVPRSDNWAVLDEAFDPPKVAVSRPGNGRRELQMVAELCTALREAQIRGQGVGAIYDRITARNAALEEEQDKMLRSLSRDAAEGIWSSYREKQILVP